jgi:hypothetical protein
MSGTKILGVVAVLLVVGLAVSFFVTNTPPAVDQVGAALTPGRVVLTDDKVIPLHTSENLERVRVCVKSEASAVAAKVNFDGRSLIVEPRECHDFSARLLSVTTTKPLSGGEHAVVTYIELKE